MTFHHTRRTPTTARLQLESLEARETPTVLGALDPTFGNDGVLTLPNGATIGAKGGQSITQDTQGRVVVLGMSGGSRTAQPTILRMNPDGTPDTSFGVGGSVTLTSAMVDFGPDANQHHYLVDSPVSVGTDAQGRILVVGHVGWETGQLAVTRFTATGQLDTSYGNGGTALLAIPTGYGSFVPMGVVVDAAGNVTIVEHLYTGSHVAPPAALGVLRLNTDGTLDPTFNGGAVRIITALTGPTVGAVTADVQGRTVIVGSAGGPDAGAFVLRLAADGSLDTTFAGGNRIFANNTYSGAVATDAAGNVYLSGSAPGFMVVVKLTEAGEIDRSFAAGGVYRLPIYTADGSMFDGFSTLRGLVVQDDGHVLIGATLVRPGTGADFAVLRLTPKGKLDPLFNFVGPMPGINVFDFGDSEYDIPRWMDVTPDGKILVGGFTGYFNSLVAKVAERLNGTLDGIPLIWDVVIPQRPFGEFGVPSRSARGNVDADGFDDTVMVTRSGRPLRVAVLTEPLNHTIVPAFDPFGDTFTGGGYVVAADFDADGRSEFVISPEDGGGARIVLYSVVDGKAVLRTSFLGIDDMNFRGGARIAVGDVNGDGVPDLIVTAGNGGGPRVAVFDGNSLLSTPRRLVNDFFALPDDLVNGVFVASQDVNRDGLDDLIFGAGNGGAPRVLAVSGKLLLDAGGVMATGEPLANFFAGDPSSRSGARVGSRDIEWDNRVELAVATDVVRVYRASDFIGNDPPESESLDLSAAAAFGLDAD